MRAEPHTPALSAAGGPASAATDPLYRCVRASASVFHVERGPAWCRRSTDRRSLCPRWSAESAGPFFDALVTCLAPGRPRGRRPAAVLHVEHDPARLQTSTIQPFQPSDRVPARARHRALADCERRGGTGRRPGGSRSVPGGALRPATQKGRFDGHATAPPGTPALLWIRPPLLSRLGPTMAAALHARTTRTSRTARAYLVSAAGATVERVRSAEGAVPESARRDRVGIDRAVWWGRSWSSADLTPASLAAVLGCTVAVGPAPAPPPRVSRGTPHQRPRTHAAQHGRERCASLGAGVCRAVAAATGSYGLRADARRTEPHPAVPRAARSCTAVAGRAFHVERTRHGPCRRAGHDRIAASRVGRTRWCTAPHRNSAHRYPEPCETGSTRDHPLPRVPTGHRTRRGRFPRAVVRCRSR